MFPQALILPRLQCLRFGLVLTFPWVFAITHVGTGLLSFPAFASRRFFAVGLFLAVLKPSESSALDDGTVIESVSL